MSRKKSIIPKEKTPPKNQEWIEMCEYVKKEILQYDNNMKFPTYLALRLKGLKDGTYLANKNIKQQANYDDKTLLYTFKLCKSPILDYLQKNVTKIKDERHKINIIMKFIEPELNDMYLRLHNAEIQKEKIDEIAFENQFNDGAEYLNKESVISDKTKERLQNLW